MKKLILVIFLISAFLEVYCQTSFNATIPFNGANASGTYKAYRDRFTNISLSNLRKPLIFIEGFDPNGIYGIDVMYGVLNQYGLAYKLHSQGYDIIVLNFNNGGDYIQRNAFLLVELINQINANKPNTEPLVVVGFSMGGLVARYALTYMEEHNMNHQTRLYVSYDSPHKGAHVPAGIQALGMTFNSSMYKSMFPDLGASLNQFQAPAASQMLKYKINSGTQTGTEIPINPSYIAFINELKGQNKCNGFPKKCRNIGISLGSWNGIAQRLNYDLDHDGKNDLQHSSMPIVYINMAKEDDESSAAVTPFWQLNTCSAIGIFSFQAVIGTSYSNTYPYFSQRSSYASLDDWYYSTYLYYNPGSFAFPYGSWSRFWNYKNYDALDFAPGSFAPAYQQLVEALNSSIQCSFSYADNSTFVSTISALDYDTDNLFYNISADPNKTDKTPFDAIFGIDGDNRSHANDQTSSSQLVSWLMNEITNNYGKACVKGTLKLENETIGLHWDQDDVIIDQADIIEATNVKIVTDNNYVYFNAGKKVVLKAGFKVKQGNFFLANISPCDIKGCKWYPQTSMVRVDNSEAFFKENNTTINNSIRENNPITVYPNPTNGSFNITSTTDNVNVIIKNALGIEIYNSTLYKGTNNIDLNVSSGIYFIQVDNYSQKLIVE